MKKLILAFKALFKEFKKYVVPHKWKYMFSALAVLLNVVFSLSNSKSREVLMEAIEKGSESELFFGFFIFATILFSLLIITQIGRTILYYCESYSTRDLSIDSFNIVCKLPMTYISHIKSADVARRINKDTVTIFQGIVRTLVYILYDSIMPFFAFFMLSLVNIYIALTAIIIAPIAMMVTVKFSKKIKIISKKNMEQVGLLSSFVQESIQNMTVLRVFNRSSYFQQEYYKKICTNADTKKKKAIIESTMYASVQTVTETLSVITVLVICLAAIKGSITVAVVLSSLYLLSLISEPFRGIAFNFGNTVEGLAAKDRVFNVINNEVEPQTAKGSINLSQQEYVLEFSDVSFSYKTKGEESFDKVLNGVSFKIKMGERVAVVGTSGGGKSTVAKLCCALYMSDSGDIKICGINTKDDILGVREKISYVPQMPYLFTGTILENISYGNEKATYEDIEKAAQRANASDFIESFSDKYNHNVGEGGSSLSGGERQRVALARAMLKDSQIFIFDEATSSLDNKSENLIQEAIDSIGKDKTVLVIAHRLSTIKNADRIIVLDEGEICEEGTHDKLISQNGKYKALYEM